MQSGQVKIWKKGGRVHKSLMRIKLKNGVEYLLHEEKGKFYLLTHQKGKTDSMFERWRNGYRKEIDPYDASVEECFDVRGWFLYDTGRPDLPKCWPLMGGDDLENNVAYLYDGHNHEGWEYLDRNLSCKKIDFREASAQYIQKEIYIKNGKAYNPPIKEKIYLPKDEFVKTYIGYCGENM